MIKTCTTCGKSYSKKEWRCLPFVGITTFEWDDVPEWSETVRDLYTGQTQESRNCSCGSTLSLVIGQTNEVVNLVLWALNDGARLQDALRSVQARCTELLEENRRLLKANRKVSEVPEEVSEVPEEGERNT